MRIVFMGTPAFAVPTMVEILKSGHELTAVYTRAPAPSGNRGLEVRKTPVHAAADSFGIPVFTPANLRSVEAQDVFARLAADVAIVTAYGLLLPIPILEAPRLGCINLHASLLPRWRGAAPIQRAIMAGDTQTGVDVMHVDAGLDAGSVAIREIIAIRPEDTSGDLTNRLSLIAARLSVSALRSIESGHLEFREQPTVGVCYARKIEKTEAKIDWTQGAERVRNQIHGLSPAPGAYSKAPIGDRHESVKFLRAEVTAGTGSPGTLLSDNMTVACGEDAIRVLQAQRPGKIVMSGRELIRGAKLAPGVVFTQ
jgi:methionyl-tRNA formyltransferase